MKTLLSLIVAVSLVSQAHAKVQNVIQTDSRVLKLNGCTGFMVDGNYLFTAKHCLNGLGQTITFKSKKDPGKNIVAKLIYVTNSSDGPIVYHLPSDSEKGYKSFKLAPSAPPVNSLVHTVGYPGGNYAVTYGTVQPGDGETYNKVKMRISPGNSGGPLINEAGQIVGLAQAVDESISSNNSYFGGWGLIQTAIQEAKKKTNSPRGPPQTKADVVIFTADWCSSCKVLASEVPDSEFQDRGMNVIKVTNNNGSWSNQNLHDEFRLRTGKSVTGLPTVWVRGTDQYQTGYTSGRRISLFGFIGGVVKGIGALLFGNGPNGEIIDEPFSGSPDFTPLPPNFTPIPPDEGEFETPLTPEGEDAPPAPGPPVSLEEIDWENVSIIIAVKEVLDYKRGIAAKIALKAIKGPINRANEELLEGKANLIFIPERTEPNKFAAFSEAAGVDPDPLYVIVLIKRQSLGLKGFIAGKIEKTIKDKIPEGTPVEIVFERVHKKSYLKITEAMKITDAGANKDFSLKEEILAGVKEQIGGLTGNVGSILEVVTYKENPPSKEEITSSILKNISPAIKELQKTQDENDEERSLFQRVIAGLLALVGAGQATGGIKGFLANRAMKKLGIKLEEKKETPTTNPKV